MDIIQLFMHLYMYELEIWLNNHCYDILNISFQSDEANTDRPLKEYLKKTIETECNKISFFSQIETIKFTDSHGNLQIYSINDDIKQITIDKVYLPEELTPNIKQTLQLRKRAVFTKPDLCLELNINGKPYFETVELKSTKSDAIPGSSIQQITPEEWVIFIKHNYCLAEITTGQYLNTINTKLQFPDRSPRPQVSFNELQKWNEQNRRYESNSLKFFSTSDEQLKSELLTDWQTVLAKRWVKIVLDNKPKMQEPWFNNNLRKFVLEFLNEYEEMPSEMKTAYKEFLSKIII